MLQGARRVCVRLNQLFNHSGAIGMKGFHLHTVLSQVLNVFIIFFCCSRFFSTAERFSASQSAFRFNTCSTLCMWVLSLARTFFCVVSNICNNFIMKLYPFGCYKYFLFVRCFYFIFQKMCRHSARVIETECGEDSRKVEEEEEREKIQSSLGPVEQLRFVFRMWGTRRK